MRSMVAEEEPHLIVRSLRSARRERAFVITVIGLILCDEREKKKRIG